MRYMQFGMKSVKQFETNIVDVFGDRGRVWLKNLPNLVDSICSDWGLDQVVPFDNLTYSYVCHAISNGPRGSD